jgi:competence protein ComEC
MYFWNSYPFVRISIAFILGIICFDGFPNYWIDANQVIPIGCVILLLCVLISRKTGFYKFRHLNGLAALLIIFILGGYFTNLKYHSHDTNHYKFISDKVRGFSGTIVSPVNERTNHFRYDLRLENYFTDSLSFSTNGIIHLYVKKDSLSNPHFIYGDHVLVKGSFYSVPGPDNPNEFDYKQYLEHQNIYSHSFVPFNDIKLTHNDPPNIALKWAYDLRDKATDIIDRNIPESRENGISKALLLGIKDHLDNDIKKSYSAAGAMHVLAVSGLHVGIIYMILQLFIGKLRNRGNAGKRLFGIISISAIWIYATVTGLSPSVLRAATMFSLVAMSEMSSKGGNIYNTLGFAAFILLMYDPYLCYSVGFQLSFAAVIGIVYLQPKLYRLLDFKIWILDKAWAITCVSIAAQLATFPLSAYYFHQFPTYFLASNLIVIPAAFIMLVSGMAMLFLDPISSTLGSFLGKALSWFMWGVNEVISLVEVLPKSLIEWIYMDRIGLIMTYIIVITIIAGLHYRSFKTLLMSSFSILFLIIWNYSSNEHQAKKHELIFFEIRDKTVIDHVNGHDARLFIDDFSSEEIELLSFQINPSRLSTHLRPISESITELPFENSGGAIRHGHVAGKKILMFDSTTFHLDFKKTISADFVIINNQSIKSLKWLSENVNAELIIIGNKNSSYYSRKMKKQATELAIPIHSLKEDGALKINLKEGIKKERTIKPAPFTTNPD